MKHNVTEEGYVVNARLKNDLSIDIYNKINSRVFWVQTQIEEAMYQYNNIEIISQDPSDYMK